jgi:hypothetical protein
MQRLLMVGVLPAKKTSNLSAILYDFPLEQTKDLSEGQGAKVAEDFSAAIQPTVPGLLIDDGMFLTRLPGSALFLELSAPLLSAGSTTCPRKSRPCGCM